MADREFDVVLFGATGYTGSLVAKDLAEVAPPGLRVALAGRSLHRLEQVRQQLGVPARNWPLIEVEASEAAGLRELTSRTHVVATSVGPFARHGHELVRAAAETGTHYADVTGELSFVRWSLDEVDAVARASGARIVHACGFDAIPSDLGVLVTAEQAAADGEGQLGDTTLVVCSVKGGGLSGGTIDSFRQGVILTHHDPATRRSLRDPYVLSPRRAEEPEATSAGHSGWAGRWRSLVPRRDAETGHWWGPAIMGPFNSAVVRMSNTLTDWSYGRSLRYREVTDLGSRPWAPAAAVGAELGLAAASVAVSWRPTRWLFDRLVPRPGDGPTAAQRAAGGYRLEIRATTTTGARYRTTVTGGDPYGASAIMLAESALCLALDQERLPHRSGVLTPATALGDALVARLRRRGLTFEVEQVRC